MIAASLFSGIGAPEQAMPHWRWAWSAEIDKFASAVLAVRHPESINLGDVTAHDFASRAAEIARPDVIVFGSPCQSFSIAGKRLGLDDPRGHLALVALALVGQLRPAWFVFENVPGLFSSDGGRDFGLFLRAVDELGYSGAWAVLDAQYFNLAQRRERVFFVGHSGDWRGPSAVLLEPESLCGDPPARGKARESFTHEIAPSLTSSGRGVEPGGDTRGGQDPVIAVAYGGNDTRGPIEVATTVRAKGGTGHGDFESETFIAFDTTQITSKENCCRPEPGDPCHPLAARAHPPAIAFADVADPVAANQARTYTREGTHNFRMSNVAITGTLNANGKASGSATQQDAESGMLITGPRVRRLTPVECERLQGFLDGYTAITYRGKPAADGPRYRALGNSMAVPVVRWILERIEVLHDRF